MPFAYVVPSQRNTVFPARNTPSANETTSFPWISYIFNFICDLFSNYIGIFTRGLKGFGYGFFKEKLLGVSISLETPRSLNEKSTILGK